MVFPYATPRTYLGGRGNETVMITGSGVFSVTDATADINLKPGNYHITIVGYSTSNATKLDVTASAYVGAGQSTTNTGTGMAFQPQGSVAPVQTLTFAATASGVTGRVAAISTTDSAGGTVNPVHLPYGFKLSFTNTSTSVGSYNYTVLATEV